MIGIAKDKKEKDSYYAVKHFKIERSPYKRKKGRSVQTVFTRNIKLSCVFRIEWNDTK